LYNIVVIMGLVDKIVKEIKFSIKLANKPARLYKYHSLKFAPHLAGFNKIAGNFEDKKGIEIGGPSRIYQKDGYLPVYPLASRVDGCNFSNNTVWENTIKAGLSYDTGSKNIGYQYIADGMDLSAIADASYDFVLSSHSLEHFANPFKALTEWLRVIKTGGSIILAVPDPRYTFDHKRSITTFEHLLQDFKNNTPESDLFHLDEVLALHDIKLDNWVKDHDDLKQRALNNIDNRCIHHHVFNLELLKQIMAYLNVKVLQTATSFPNNLIVIGAKE